MALIESFGPGMASDVDLEGARRSGDEVVRRWAKVIEKLSLAPEDWGGVARALEGLANVAGAGMGRKGCEMEFAKRVLPHMTKAFSEARAVGAKFGGPQPWGREYVIDWRSKDAIRALNAEKEEEEEVDTFLVDYDSGEEA